MAAKLRFGIIGCGVISGSHARALAQLHEYAELVAVADAQRERADKLAVAYGATPHYDYHEMLRRPDLDAVSVCVPSGAHASVMIDVLQAGKHVICEKPFDITTAAIDRVLAVLKRTDRKLTVIHQNRFHPSVQVVKQAIDAGKFGRLTFGSAQIPWWRGQGYYDAERWRGTWRMDGGGALMNQGVHTIDLLQWMLGPAVEVQAYVGTLAHQMETEDVGMAVVKFANGALGAIEGTTALYPGLPVRLVVGGDAGSAVIEGSKLTWLHCKADGAQEAGPYGGVGEGDNQAEAVLAAHQEAAAAREAGAPAGDAHQSQMLDFIQAIREDRDPAITPEEARNAVAIITAIYESARTGKPVAVSRAEEE